MRSDPHTAVFTARIVADGQARIERLVLDEDGDWQAIDALSERGEDDVVIGLGHLPELDDYMGPLIDALEDRGRGWQAVRTEKEWRIVPFPNRTS